MAAHFLHLLLHSLIQQRKMFAYLQFFSPLPKICPPMILCVSDKQNNCMLKNHEVWAVMQNLLWGQLIWMENRWSLHGFFSEGALCSWRREAEIDPCEIHHTAASLAVNPNSPPSFHFLIFAPQMSTWSLCLQLFIKIHTSNPQDTQMS